MNCREILNSFLVESSDEEDADYENRRRRIRRLYMIQAIRYFFRIIERAYPERRMWNRIRSDSWWEIIVLQNFTEEEFKENFRMERSTFQLLCNHLRPYLTKQQAVRQPLSVEKQIATTLVKLSSTSELRIIANNFGVARSTLCTTINKVCRVIMKEMPIKFQTQDEIKQISEEFFDKSGLPGCCGAIDGSHIPIKAPTENKRDYFCRKQFYCIILQAVVTYDCKFMHIYVGWPGSVHDARVFINSEVYKRAEEMLPKTIVIQNSEMKPYIVGDSAYPLLPFLMKPYSNPSVEQDNFNSKLSQARVKVEHTFGILKGRWRCLLKQNDAELKNCVAQVYACCALHNLCESVKDEYDEDWSTEEFNEVQSENSESVSQQKNNVTKKGKVARDHLLNIINANFSKLK